MDTNDFSDALLPGDGRHLLACSRPQAVAARLQAKAAGYSQIGHVNSTAEGVAAKAMMDGGEVRLVVDSSGQVLEQR